MISAHVELTTISYLPTSSTPFLPNLLILSHASCSCSLFLLVDFSFPPLPPQIISPLLTLPLHQIHGPTFEFSPACSLATLSLYSTHSANFTFCIGYKIGFFSYLSCQTQQEKFCHWKDWCPVDMHGLSSSLQWVFTSQPIFYHWSAHSLLPFSDYSKNLKSFPWVHHSVVDLTFCFTEKVERPLNMKSNFLLLMCTLKSTLISSLLQELSH